MPSPSSRPLPTIVSIASVVAAGVCAWGWYASAGTARDLERELAFQTQSMHSAVIRWRGLRDAESARATALRQQLDQAEATAAADRSLLERQLEEAMAQAGTLREVAARAEEAMTANPAEDGGFDVAPMPEGLRLCLIAFHELLIEDGVVGMRILRTEGIEERELRQLELLDHDPDTFLSTLYQADRMWVTVDREAGRVELRFFDGRRSSRAEQAVFPEEGYAVVIPDADCRAWEQRLPYLVRSMGEWPVETEQVPEFDPAVAAAWRGRLDQLLAMASGERKLRVKDLRSITNGVFGAVALAGYEKLLLASYLEAEEVEVLVDDLGGLVYLELRRGLMRDEHGQNLIGASGFRVLLDGVKPIDARRVLMGMVATIE